jgi:ribonuclease VapC
VSVLDASALLAILFDEPGRDAATAHLDNGGASLVNVTEVLSVLVRRGAAPERALELLKGLGLTWTAPDVRQAVRAAALNAHRGISLGDSFCMALAEALSEPVVTADHAWASLPLAVPVELIR